MYKKKFLTILFGVISILLATTARAENSQDFGDYVVHFNALSTVHLPPAVTKQYGIKRSMNRGIARQTLRESSDSRNDCHLAY